MSFSRLTTLWRAEKP